MTAFDAILIAIWWCVVVTGWAVMAYVYIGG